MSIRSISIWDEKILPWFHIFFHKKLGKPPFSTGKCEPSCRIVPFHILDTWLVIITYKFTWLHNHKTFENKFYTPGSTNQSTVLLDMTFWLDVFSVWVLKFLLKSFITVRPSHVVLQLLSKVSYLYVKEQPIKMLYPANTIFWLDNFGVPVQILYSKFYHCDV